MPRLDEVSPLRQNMQTSKYTSTEQQVAYEILCPDIFLQFFCHKKLLQTQESNHGDHGQSYSQPLLPVLSVDHFPMPSLPKNTGSLVRLLGSTHLFHEFVLS